MSHKSVPTCAVARYESVWRNSRHSRLRPGCARPQPPSAWPPENVALLERYLTWLVADGAGVTCMAAYYIPMAGHVLGLNLKPHTQLNLDSDLERAMTYVQAKQPGRRWVLLCGNALNRFRRFLQAERGMVTAAVHFKSVNVARYQEGLPAWLVAQLTHYQQLRQVNWRPTRLPEAIRRFWSSHSRLWRWLFAHYSIQTISDIKRPYLFAYMDERLAAGRNPKTVNQELRAFQATLRFLQEREFVVPPALLRLPGLKEAASLPRFLTDEQVSQLRADLEQRVQQADSAVSRRDALLDRAAFYLLWQGGLRLGEVEELTLAHLNLRQQQLIVRQGKGMRDRAVYLTDRAVAALQEYLAVRGHGPSDHLFLFRHRPPAKDFIRGRIQAAGKRTGVKVTPHQLRHTYATQLLNAGCRITTIQALLGHQHLSTTLTYARVHDRTVAQDYFAAMSVVEKGLKPATRSYPPEPLVPANGLAQQGHINRSAELLRLVNALADHKLDERQRALVAALHGRILALPEVFAEQK